MLALALSQTALADGGPCNCTEQCECSFMTCCYSGGLCMPDGTGDNGHKCKTYLAGGGGCTYCEAGDTCTTDKRCNSAD